MVFSVHSNVQLKFYNLPSEKSENQDLSFEELQKRQN